MTVERDSTTAATPRAIQEAQRRKPKEETEHELL